MFGIVLWSDSKDGKAVFWCEDQGELAYFETTEVPADNNAQFGAGDMVQFDVSVEQRLRRASNARLIVEQAYSRLPEKLRQNATQVSEEPVGLAKVIPLRPFLRRNRPRRERPEKRKA